MTIKGRLIVEITTDLLLGDYHLGENYLDGRKILKGFKIILQ